MEGASEGSGDGQHPRSLHAPAQALWRSTGMTTGQLLDEADNARVLPVDRADKFFRYSPIAIEDIGFRKLESAVTVGDALV